MGLPSFCRVVERPAIFLWSEVRDLGWVPIIWKAAGLRRKCKVPTIVLGGHRVSCMFLSFTNVIYKIIEYLNIGFSCVF